MSFRNLLEIGDAVVLDVDPSARAWNKQYDFLPNGTTGVICGFHDDIIYRERIPTLGKVPGTYHSKGSASVWLPSGRIIDGEWWSMIDKDEEKRRDFAHRDENGKTQESVVRLGDLPSTLFWEQDVVQVTYQDEAPEIATISRIDYKKIQTLHSDGSPYSFYSLEYSPGVKSRAKEDWLQLIERGNVWKHYNDQSLTFKDKLEEINFFRLIDQIK